ncbi:MAG: glycoside hydrolase family 3 C-terminal domain-containing protein [Clostridia bacterium]|nr:glycoside hydrolase family 3 C-terminal domain-containing protein [Clostridia bacterium]
MKTKRIVSVLLAVLLIFFEAVTAGAALDKKGDINGDGAVSAEDARLALRYAVKLENLSGRQIYAAKVTGGNKVTAADARAILRRAVGLTVFEDDETTEVSKMLSAMTLEEKIAQMIMPAVRYWGGEGVTELNSTLSSLIKEYPFAGVILFAQNTQTSEQTLRLTDSLQKANSTEGRPQLFIAADQEGGKITRLQTGTQTPGNMALGATGDEECARTAAGIIGEELSAVGINVDFAPVLDINSEPSNPVIGVRSFSDNAALTAKLGRGYIKGLQDYSVIPSLKHFPGHGDTATDSHTGLPSINKTYAQIKNQELVPFVEGIAEGAQMIMTAHIQFPKIETSTYVSKSTGKPVYLPATLSKKIITDILRGDMGFDGVVVTDAMNMDAVAKHFSASDAARLAINAGVDILLTPVDISSSSGIANMKRYIKNLVSLVNNGSISIKNVNASVERILRLKYRQGLFTVYNGSGLDQDIKTAKATVGSEKHHETEFELAKRAVTMVKNSASTLPIQTKNKRILILTEYSNELLSVEYAVDKLKSDGVIPNSADIVRYCYTTTSQDTLNAQIKKADYVIAISELYSESALSGSTCAFLDTAISTAHKNGAKFILLSAQLPYDAARFQSADAILLCWSDKGMSEDPRVAGGDVTGYGPNIPAAVYAAFDSKGGPKGKLPVNIPKLTSGYKYSSTVLYPFGYGLTY